MHAHVVVVLANRDRRSAHGAANQDDVALLIGAVRFDINRDDGSQSGLFGGYAGDMDTSLRNLVGLELLEDDPGFQEHLLLMGLYQLSLIYLRRGDYKSCEEYCMKALEIKENYIDPMLNLGMCYFYTIQYDKALEILEKFLDYRKKLIEKEEFNLLILNKLGSDYEALYLIGEIFRLQKDYGKAKECFASASQSNNLFWNIHNSLGKLCLDEKDYAGAVSAFENAIKYGYLNAEHYGTIGSSQDEYKQAIENYKLAIEKDIVKQRSRPTVRDALGKIDALLEE